MATKAKKPEKTKVKVLSDKPIKSKITLLAPFYALGGYLKGSWQELRQVRWPNRRATWGLTGAVILFTAFFVGLIILLDWIFNQLFKLLIK
jgi:preprotein translocase subunit SecE